MEKKSISLNGKLYYFNAGKLFCHENPDIEIDPQTYAYTQARDGSPVLILGTHAYLPEQDFKEIPCCLLLKNDRISYFRTDIQDTKNSCVFTLFKETVRVIGRGFEEIVPGEVYLIGRQLHQIYDNDFHFMQHCENLEIWTNRIEAYEGDVRWSKVTVYKKTESKWKEIHHSVPRSYYIPRTKPSK